MECREHIDLARETAEQSFVLLRNEGNLLPLDNSVSIAVVGDLADEINLGDRGSSMVTSTEVATPLAGLRAYGNEANVSGFGSADNLSGLGDFNVAVVVAGLTFREEGEFIPTQQQDAEGSELARGGDRDNLRLPIDQEEMISRVASVAKKTVVLLEGGSAIDVSPWVDEVDALVMIWYPGREGGHAVARILFGEVCPSGRLPVTFPRSIKDLMDWDIQALDVPHDLYHGYRYLDRENTSARYPFGFGLSYTSFAFDGLQVERTIDRFFFNVTVTNTGTRAGATVPQVYLSCTNSSVERVKRELKGFGRLELEPGDTVDLEIEICDEDLCYYDPESGWTLETCTYDFWVADSAEDMVLQTTWSFDGEDWLPE